MPHCNCLPGKYCGRTLPEPVNASTQSLYIIFHSDEMDASKGFKVEWTSTEPPTIESDAHGKNVALRKIVMKLIFVARAKLKRSK